MNRKEVEDILNEQVRRVSWVEEMDELYEDFQQWNKEIENDVKNLLSKGRKKRKVIPTTPAALRRTRRHLSVIAESPGDTLLRAIRPLKRQSKEANLESEIPEKEHRAKRLKLTFSRESSENHSLKSNSVDKRTSNGKIKEQVSENGDLRSHPDANNVEIGSGTLGQDSLNVSHMISQDSTLFESAQENSYVIAANKEDSNETRRSRKAKHSRVMEGKLRSSEIHRNKNNFISHENVISETFGRAITRGNSYLIKDVGEVSNLGRKSGASSETDGRRITRGQSYLSGAANISDNPDLGGKSSVCNVLAVESGAHSRDSQNVSGTTSQASTSESVVENIVENREGSIASGRGRKGKRSRVIGGKMSNTGLQRNTRSIFREKVSETKGRRITRAQSCLRDAQEDISNNQYSGMKPCTKNVEDTENTTLNQDLQCPPVATSQVLTLENESVVENIDVVVEHGEGRIASGRGRKGKHSKVIGGKLSNTGLQRNTRSIFREKQSIVSETEGRRITRAQSCLRDTEEEISNNQYSRMKPGVKMEEEIENIALNQDLQCPPVVTSQVSTLENISPARARENQESSVRLNSTGQNNLVNVEEIVSCSIDMSNTVPMKDGKIKSGDCEAEKKCKNVSVVLTRIEEIAGEKSSETKESSDNNTSGPVKETSSLRKSGMTRQTRLSSEKITCNKHKEVNSISEISLSRASYAFDILMDSRGNENGEEKGLVEEPTEPTEPTVIKKPTPVTPDARATRKGVTRPALFSPYANETVENRVAAFEVLHTLAEQVEIPASNKRVTRTKTRAMAAAAAAAAANDLLQKSQSNISNTNIPNQKRARASIKKARKILAAAALKSDASKENTLVSSTTSSRVAKGFYTPLNGNKILSDVNWLSSSQLSSLKTPFIGTNKVLHISNSSVTQSSKSAFKSGVIITNKETFIKKPAKCTQNVEARKLEEQKRREEKEREAQQRKEEFLKRQAEEIRRKRDEQRQRVQEKREAQEKEKQESQLRVGKEKDEKWIHIQQEREAMMKENVLKKKLESERKAAEARRKMEEAEAARLAKLKLEEQQHKEEEEAAEKERLKRIEEEKEAALLREKFEKKQREIELAKAAKENAGTQKKNVPGVKPPIIINTTFTKPLNSTFNLHSSSNNSKIQVGSNNAYNLEELLSGESDDDSEETPKRTARWAKKSQLLRCARMESVLIKKAIEDFCFLKSINITDIFPNKRGYKRTSSAIWHTPPRYSILPKY